MNRILNNNKEPIEWITRTGSDLGKEKLRMSVQKKQRLWSPTSPRFIPPIELSCSTVPKEALASTGFPWMFTIVFHLILRNRPTKKFFKDFVDGACCALAHASHNPLCLQLKSKNISLGRALFKMFEKKHDPMCN